MAEPTTAGPQSRSRFAEALRPLASLPYRLMWMGSTTSSIGDAVVQIALVFAILHVGGTASDIGVIAAVSTVARIAFVLAGGVWADRLRRQYVMLTADAVRGVVQATLAVLLLSGHAHVWELGVGAALYGAATSFFDPASNALVPETVPTAELQQANSLLGLPQSFFSIGGPAAGGVLIAVFGTGWLFAADAATFFVSLVCLALLRVPPRPMPPPASFLADLGEGWHELAIRPWYWITLSRTPAATSRCPPSSCSARSSPRARSAARPPGASSPPGGVSGRSPGAWSRCGSSRDGRSSSPTC